MYDYVSMIIAGLASQIRQNGRIENFDKVSEFSCYSFLTIELSDKYFPAGSGLDLFLAHLFLEQRQLDMCLNLYEESNPIIDVPGRG